MKPSDVILEKVLTSTNLNLSPHGFCVQAPLRLHKRKTGFICGDGFPLCTPFSLLPLLERNEIILKEKNRKQLKRNQNEGISKTKLFGANFMQIGL